VLVFVKVRDVDAEERVGYPGGRCRIGKVDVDEEHGDETEDWVPAPCTATSVGIQRPDDAILIFIPVDYVLLYNLM
jgi:hypothetical protein